MTKRVVFLNAPPRAGKDSLCDYAVAQWPFYAMKFAAPIRRAVRAQWDLTDEEIAAFEADKDAPRVIFGDRSYRRVLIDYSEQYIKPMFGSRTFGRQAAREAYKANGRPIIFSDAGFTPEEQAFIDNYDMDAQYLIIRIARPHCRWDSRHRLHPQDFGQYGDRVSFIDLMNDRSLPEFLQSGFNAIMPWMNPKT